MPELYSQRWEWARRAEDRFTAGLPDSLQSRVELRAGEYSAVLLGPTQVGKTSLVLDVLGCRNEARAEVDRVLRAGRVLGMSSTSTATTYRWADDAELWSMTLGETTVTATSDELMGILSGLRREDGRLVNPGDVVQLWIPRKHRGETDRAALPVLLDLPGLFVDKDHERAQAREVARSMVSMANVVILLVNAAQMTPLTRMGRDSIPEVAGWAFHPEKFRVVLTHAFSQGSLKATLTEQATVEQWRQTVLDELIATIRIVREACSKPGLATAVRDSLFPVEMGGSMADLQREDPAAGAIALRLNEQLMKQLITGLDEAAAEDAIYLSLPRATHIVRDRARQVLGARTRRLEAARASERRAADIVSGARVISGKADAALHHAQTVSGWMKSLRSAPVQLAWENSTPAPVDRSDEDLQRHYAETLATADRAMRSAFDAWFDQVDAVRLAEATGVPIPLSPLASAIVARKVDCDTICARRGTTWHCHRSPFRFASSRDCLPRQLRGFDKAADEAFEVLRSAIDEWLTRVSTDDAFPDLKEATRDAAAKTEAVRRAERELRVAQDDVAKRVHSCLAAEHACQDVELQASRLDRYLDDELSEQIAQLEAASEGMDDDDLLASAIVYLLMLRGREQMRRTTL